MSHVTHEFKNMAAGGPETMLAVPKLSNESKFNWTECESPIRVLADFGSGYVNN